LVRHFPNAFPSNYDVLLSLKLGIEADILDQLIQWGKLVNLDVLRRVLANHPDWVGYLLLFHTAAMVAALIPMVIRQAISARWRKQRLRICWRCTVNASR
jgi:hypothetical protein